MKTKDFEFEDPNKTEETEVITPEVEETPVEAPEVQDEDNSVEEPQDSELNCSNCKGLGLLNPTTICGTCQGTGKV